MTSVGVPIKILHEAEGHVVTLETVTGVLEWLGALFVVLFVEVRQVSEGSGSSTAGCHLGLFPSVDLSITSLYELSCLSAISELSLL
ncbi:unnamed protein product [Cylicostephanus goldi]|uniref:Uncharacterized protein n=1 Tax=Cylicostephanus goldi TaxID=71465 RepID=A0A3P7M6H1_CYLGO|nr:unnamed protein product [Cylicostephanus goldi]